MPAEFLYNLTKKTVGASSAQALCGVALKISSCYRYDNGSFYFLKKRTARYSVRPPEAGWDGGI